MAYGSTFPWPAVRPYVPRKLPQRWLTVRTMRQALSRIELKCFVSRCGGKEDHDFSKDSPERVWEFSRRFVRQLYPTPCHGVAGGHPERRVTADKIVHFEAVGERRKAQLRRALAAATANAALLGRAKTASGLTNIASPSWDVQVTQGDIPDRVASPFGVRVDGAGCDPCSSGEAWPRARIQCRM